MKNQKGLAPAKILLILLIVGLLGSFGWYFFNGKDNSSNSPDTNITSATGEKIDIPAGWAAYENKDLGFKFRYPSEWGTVSTETNGSKTTLIFSKNNQLVFGLVSKNWTPVPNNGGCYTILGFTKDPSPRETNFDDQYSKAISYYLLNTDRVKVVEGFEYYDFNFAGETNACPGLWFDSAVTFSKNAKYAGVEAFWRQLNQEGCCTGPTFDEYNAYEKDKTTQLSEDKRQEIVTVIQSIKEL